MSTGKGPWVRGFVDVCAAAAAGLGAISLAGWITGVDSLISLAPGLPGMKVNSALAFLCAGVSLLLNQRGRRAERIALLLAAVAALVGILEASATLFGLDIGIDQLLARDHLPQGFPPGRVAVRTALMCLLDALALLVWHKSRRWRPVVILAFTAAQLELFSLAAALFKGALRGHFGGLPILPLNTLVAAGALTLGILSLHPDRGIAAMLLRPGFSGMVARRLLPAALLAPMLLGWFRLWAQEQHWFGTEFGVAFLTSSTAIIIAGLVWWSAGTLSELERCLAQQQAVVTERDRELRRRAELIDHSNDAIFTMDHDRRIRSWNRGAEQLYGWSAAEAIGKVSHELLQTEGLLPASGMDRVLAAAGTWAGELRHRRRDQQIVLVDSRHLLLHGETPEACGILEINRDITASRAVEEQLRQSQRLESIGQLAGGIAHDFNNLLTVISGYSGMLASDVQLTAETRESAQEIAGAAKRASAITRQLLTFSRRQVTVRQFVEINSIVAAMEKMLRHLIGEHIDLAITLNHPAAIVHIDPGNLEQVVLNLVINARDAIQRQGRILIETATLDVDAGFSATHFGLQPGAYALLSVSDTGAGMPPEVKARIFEPFFTTKEPGKGTGLGLSTVHGIVRQNQGAIQVYSEVGKGTTFKVLLPASSHRAEEAPRVLDRPAPIGTETILLAEDEESLRNYIRRVLEKHGYRVLAAENGRAALSLLQDGAEPALLLSDVVMPEMGGLDLAARAAELRPGIRVVHMSGYADQLRGAAPLPHFLQKPFTAPVLLAKVRAVLDEPAG